MATSVYSHVVNISKSKVLIIWLDEDIGKPGACEDLKKKFPETVGTIVYFFNSIIKCHKFIRENNFKKIFLIVQGKLFEHILTILPTTAELISIYLFCFDPVKYAEMFIENMHVLEGGIYYDDQVLLAKLAQDVKTYLIEKVHVSRQEEKECREWIEVLIDNIQELKTLFYDRHPDEPELYGKRSTADRIKDESIVLELNNSVSNVDAICSVWLNLQGEAPQRMLDIAQTVGICPKYFDNTNNCLQFINQTQKKRILLIISTNHYVPAQLLSSVYQVGLVYILCANELIFENYPKVTGIFKNETLLISTAAADIALEYKKLGDKYCEEHDAAKARTCYQQGMEIYRKLAKYVEMNKKKK
ncbi:unnamed protein product [Didymodactylos carnosus]|uniref:Uncharacterized protein n=1 Tax=Didymodactylos carnosus TaxID=1234261 RepID=A0A814YQW6_9BILA|nr:unnamed protein product [Didymodactylos carnosus]CAF1232116.1 unnamed protein product [Didymodactylos carnosus]CAF3846061.1 unnamed protein product [Didymodactylos carnosus]CAF3994792.1 unnamed protein product [Didymodactylos carnosus]